MYSITNYFYFFLKLWNLCYQISIGFARSLESNNLRAALKLQCHPRVIGIIHLNGDSFIIYNTLIA